MRTQVLMFTLIALLTEAPPTPAAELAKIERVLGKEPKYTGNPRYCLLVFGPEAKFRVWLVLDGTVLYVDRDGSGDLSVASKRVPANYHKEDRLVFRPGQIAPPGMRTTYNLAQLRTRGEACDMTIYLGDDMWRAGFDGPGALRFADRPQDAPIIHFLGPLTLHRFEPQPDSVSPDCKPGPLVRGQNCKLGFSLGTLGIGSGAFAKYRLPNPGPASAEIRFANGKNLTVSLAPDD